MGLLLEMCWVLLHVALLIVLYGLFLFITFLVLAEILKAAPIVLLVFVPFYFLWSVAGLPSLLDWYCSILADLSAGTVSGIFSLFG